MPFLMLASATGRPAYEWPCAASLSSMSTDYKTGNSIHMATFYLLPPTLPIASGHTFPPTILGPGPSVCGASGRFSLLHLGWVWTSNSRLGSARETRWDCECGSADDLGLVWYVRGCSRVAESEAQGGRGMALARGASRERSHLRLTTFLLGLGWPDTDTVNRRTGSRYRPGVSG